MKLEPVNKTEGKSMNAVKHGLTSNKMFVLANETPEKWRQMLETWKQKLRPRDDAENQIVTEAAFARWRLHRVWTIETALYDHEMDAQADTLEEQFDPVDEGIRLASAFKALADNSVSLELIHRYETRHRRSFEKALASLKALRELDPEPEEQLPVPVPAPETRPQTAAKKQPVPCPTAPKQFLPNETPAASAPAFHRPQPAAPSLTQPKHAFLQHEDSRRKDAM